MSKVFNMVGGGGGKNISSIIITGLESTDTVTCIKDGKSYPATWDENSQHWEIVGLPLGTFTLTTTNGTKTSTETVFIDIAGVYEIEMSYKLWLYRDGDECEDVTGGLTEEGYTFYPGYTTYAGTKNDNNIYFPQHGSSSSGLLSWSCIGTSKAIDLSGYSKVYMEFQNESMTNSRSVQLTISSSKDNIVNTSVFELVDTTGTTAVKTISDNIALTGSYYISVGCTNGRSGYLHKVWFE